MLGTKTMLAALVFTAVAGSAHAKGLTIEDVLAMQRVGEPKVSPDGKWAVFTVRETDMDANRGRFDLWMVGTDGSNLTRLTSHPDNDTDPAWSKDGKWIYFTSTRSGSAQVWRIKPTGGEAEQVTKLDTDINGFRVMPDGKRLVLAIDVWPDARTLADSIKKDEANSKPKSKVKIYDQALFRHWDQWEDGKFSHLFVWSSDKDVRDLTPGLSTDTPVHPFGGMESIDLSPDGAWLAYNARVGGRDIAFTTNTDIFLVATDGKSKAINITAENKAYDFEPAFSPDGKSIAFTAMKRPGYEADRQRVSIYDVASKKIRVLTEAWDFSASGTLWSADGKSIYTTAQRAENQVLWAIDVATGAAKPVIDKGTISSPALAGTRLVFVKDSAKQPADLYSSNADGSDVRQLTAFNKERLSKISLGDWEQFSFKGAKGDTVFARAFKPADFKGGKAPVVLLIHGGPQSPMADHWHYRWNPELFAGHGYAVLMVDFHGTPGYGQAFTDAIQGDWGGAPYEDLMAGLDAALAKYSWMDGTRVTAAGASYGGFMINYLNGKTDRFKALVCHDGLFDLRMAYYDTEEVWFPEWEHKGTPYEKPEEYSKWSPVEFVKNWKTPMLVIHGGLDYRIPDTHGMAAFTALQRKNIPSRFIEFPDENHWVLKPQNSKVWYDEVLAWLDRFTKRK